jgi:PIN domain nuclease of toxin-antitoxin system
VILLDTCTLLWLAEDPPRLPRMVMAAIRHVAPGQRFLSAISAFEIGVKYRNGKLSLPKKPRQWVDESCAKRGLIVVPVTKDIAHRATELALYHRDPADRIIIATALEHDLTVLTPDLQFRRYKPIKLAWDR